MIGSFGDRGGDMETYRIYTVHSDMDVDWYRIDITDETDVLPPYNPRIRVGLGAIPAGADYDLGAWYDCASGGGMDLSCEVGEANDLGGDIYGCVSARPGAMSESVELNTECDGVDESGTLLIRVLPRTYTGVCAPYELNFELD
jgi:hypothetical protein